MTTGYEIPDQLEYEREWIAGLTMRKIMLLSISMIVAGTISMITPGDTASNVTVFAMIMAVGATITMKEMDKDIVELLQYAARWNVAGYLDETAYMFMNIEDIKGQKIIQKDRYQTAVIRVEPINFEVKSEEERTSILANYKKFLQSIEHPIHLIIRTVDSIENVEQYFDHNRKKVKDFAEKNNKPELKTLFRKQRDFYLDYVQENTVKDKVFYIAVKVDTNQYNNPDQELDLRAQEIRSMLGDCGLKTERLNTNQLYSLMASYFQDAVVVDKNYEFPYTLLKQDDLEKYGLNREQNTQNTAEAEN